VLALLAMLAAACASGSADAPAMPAASPGDPASAAAEFPSDAPAAASAGVRAGWLTFKPPTKAGQVTTLTLVGENTEEGKLLSRGRVRLDGGKVVDEKTAANLADAFRQAGFDRFCVKRRPLPAPAGALAAVWIDRGQGVETLFLMPGARQNPATEDLPDVYDGLKKLILSVHITTPGSVVLTGEGWSGDDMLRQKPGSGGR